MDTVTLATPTFNPVVPTAATSCVLIDLSIKVWTGRILDKEASNDVTQKNNADMGIATVTKRLMAGCEELRALIKHGANSRNLHYAMTAPFSDTGLRVCLMPAYIKANGYEQTMSAAQAQFYKLRDALGAVYDWEVAQAQVKARFALGDLYRAEEYPKWESLVDKFQFRYNAMPMPESGNWVMDISNASLDAMREQYETFRKEQLLSAMHDIWKRAHTALSKMSERLDYPDGEDKTTRKIFHNSLVDNVMEIVDLMDGCNITNDPTMTAAKQQLEQALRGVTPAALREDNALRAKTKKQVDDIKKIIDNLPSIGI